MGDKAVAITEAGDVPMRAMSTAAVLAQVAQVQDIMRKVMRDGEHYGTIPGTDKPALLKAGAEKLSFTFRLLPKYRITARDMPNLHREYEVVCELWHESGVFAGEGVGNCSTMESKYRWRPAWEDTGDAIPKDSKDRKEEYRKQGFGMKKDASGKWLWVRYLPDRAENPDIADTYNTVLKMAKKRAHVDAAITACAASDIFTQDVEQDEVAEPRTVSQPDPPPSRPEDQMEVIREIKGIIEHYGIEGKERDYWRTETARATTVEGLVAVLGKLKAEEKEMMNEADKP
jgi:hypothetical protein